MFYFIIYMSVYSSKYPIIPFLNIKKKELTLDVNSVKMLINNKIPREPKDSCGIGVYYEQLTY